MTESESLSDIDREGSPGENECTIEGCNKKHSMSIVVTNIDADFFSSSERKKIFEAKFCSFDVLATFQYLSCFRRVRVNFRSCESACRARSSVHDTCLADCTVKCYFIQVRSCSADSGEEHLQPPSPRRQFIISPPASPPDEWLQAMEARPAAAVASDLASAVANLTPGEHELIPCDEQGLKPAIVLHVSGDSADISTDSTSSSDPVQKT